VTQRGDNAAGEHDHGIRAVKDAMSKQILSELNGAGIQVASATFEIVGLPPLRIVGFKNTPG